jgi:Domain of unknown function (DUF4476)
MKQLLYFTSVLILFFSPVRSFAQLNHFIYLQTENKQPFYVKMDKKVFNSTISGYLIIPKLQNGTYNFAIGFLNEENKEHDFSCTINNKDVGYLVKNFADNGWGLFNLQGLQVVMSGAKEPDIAQTTKTDAFSNLLSDVVNDPAIKQENLLVNEAKQKNTIPQVAPDAAKIEAALTVTALDTKKTVPEEKLDTSASTNPILLNTITKKDVINNQDGLQVTYIDLINGVPDTINVIIPTEGEKYDGHNDTTLKKGGNETLKKDDDLLQKSGTNIKSNDTIQGASQNLNKQGSETISPANATKKEEDKKFLEIDLANSNQQKTDSAVVKKVDENPSEQVTNNALMINSDCKSNAQEEDFLKLRKKMASAKSEEEMLSSAKKTFKVKCFTTDQIKNLGVLFLNDEGRYNFFDVAYPFVSDTRNYKQLEDQLTDSYYKSRFQAMIRR